MRFNDTYGDSEDNEMVALNFIVSHTDNFFITLYFFIYFYIYHV
jgi:hypothetical protein